MTDMKLLSGKCSILLYLFMIVGCSAFEPPRFEYRDGDTSIVDSIYGIKYGAEESLPPDIQHFPLRIEFQRFYQDEASNNYVKSVVEKYFGTSDAYPTLKISGGPMPIDSERKNGIINDSITQINVLKTHYIATVIVGSDSFDICHADSECSVKETRNLRGEGSFQNGFSEAGRRSAMNAAIALLLNLNTQRHELYKIIGQPLSPVGPAPVIPVPGKKTDL